MNQKSDLVSDQNHSTQIKKMSQSLRNVGPKLAERLINAGISTPEELRKLGAKAAFLKLYPDGDAYGDYNAAYLYALEGAIRDCDWLEIPDAVKAVHKEFAQELQQKFKNKQ